jgi:hypothetical protein
MDALLDAKPSRTEPWLVCNSSPPARIRPDVRKEKAP